ncbi:MAG: hypothetical protein K2X87_27195 [Gemmataceae bacterium]|nr:hypothetical protein [Gemmataceae bacterium]
MASVLRIAAVGLPCAGLALAVWVGSLLPTADPARPGTPQDWLTLLYSFGWLLVLPWLAVGFAVVFWSAARLTDPRPGRRWAGSTIRGLAALVGAVGVVAVADCLQLYLYWYLTMARDYRDPGGWVVLFFGVPLAPNAAAAWATLGVGGLGWAVARLAYPPPNTYPAGGDPMALALRVLAVALVVAGAAGFVGSSVAGYHTLTGDRRGTEPSAVGYGLLLIGGLFSLIVAGLGGVLWATTRLAYPPKPAAPVPEGR